jgi:cyclopropane-fatty-acyl-phospholipid synthase
MNPPVNRLASTVWQPEQETADPVILILSHLLEGYPAPLAIRLWDDRVYRMGQGEPAFGLHLKQPEVLRDLIFSPDPVRLAEAYFDGEVDVHGDFNAAFGLRSHLEKLRFSLIDKLNLAKHARKIVAGTPRKTPRADSPHRANGKESIAFHYDVSNEFYRLWLDQHMVYSCAYFESPSQSLDQAQCNKLDYICRKLRLKPGEILLDIGCGWGALACWAAQHYGVYVHGVTLSRKQHEYAQKEVARRGLTEQVKIDLMDYRDIPGEAVYDKVSSIGMFEHVGLKNMAGYFGKVHRLLKPGGLFLNHGITSDEPGWSEGVSTRFINRHVFPDGELDTVSNVLCRMEDARFEIFDVEGLRPHYALTLRHWVRRLEDNANAAMGLVGERTFKIWRLYMTGCAQQFEDGATGIYQILATRKAQGIPMLPLTRRDLYARRTAIH